MTLFRSTASALIALAALGATTTFAAGLPAAGEGPFAADSAAAVVSVRTRAEVAAEARLAAPAAGEQVAVAGNDSAGVHPTRAAVRADALTAVRTGHAPIAGERS